MRRWIFASIASIVLIAAALAGCSKDKPVKYQPAIDPAQFSTTIDNPWLPWRPGTRYTFHGQTEDGFEVTVVEVTHETKVIMGVTCVVVRDTVTVDGVLREDTYDWYAQHADGTVWYFGEDTKAYDPDGSVDTGGSFQAGVDGAQPGIVMTAQPTVGERYRQEYYKGEAEDEAKIVSLNETATVGSHTYTDLVMTEEFTRLEPEVVEHKYYAKGIGVVLVVHVKGPAERVELVAVQQP